MTTSLVSFYNGFVIPLPAVIAAVRKGSDALLAVDVTQALGRIPLDLTGVDLIVSSTHKWILGTHGGRLIGVPRAQAGVDGAGRRLVQPRGRVWSSPFRAGGQPSRGSELHRGHAQLSRVYAIAAALEFIKGIGVAEIDRVARPLVLAALEGLAGLPVELLTPREESALAGILALRHPRADEIARSLRARGIHLMCHARRCACRSTAIIPWPTWSRFTRAQ